MTDKTFPHYNESKRTAEKGVTFVKMKVENDLDWIFRSTHLEDDYGIDGYIDIIGINNSVTGKYLGVQIKTGKSYFKTKKGFGWEFKGENKHLNYYLNLDKPIIIILVNLEQQVAFWGEFDLNKVTKTSTGWSILIPEYNELSKNSKQEFKKLVGNIVDYMPQLEYQWKLNEKIKNSSFTYLNVSREEIINKDVSGFTIMLNKLTIDEEMIKKARGAFSFTIDGYENDSRELLEIPEVREWAKLVIPAFKYWGYFLNMEDFTHKIIGLRVLHFCSVDIEIVDVNEVTKDYKAAPDINQTFELMDNLFLWLNEFCEKYSISSEINDKQSNLISKVLFGLDKNNIPNK